MDDTLIKPPAAKPKGRPKGSKSMAVKVAESAKELKAEIEEARSISGEMVRRDEQGRILPGSSLATARTRWLGAAAWLRARYPQGELLVIAAKIADGTARATREQTMMLKDLLDRTYGRSPETHLVGAMPEEQRELAAELTKEQLLGLLDAGSLATESATVNGEVLDSTDGTY